MFFKKKPEPASCDAALQRSLVAAGEQEKRGGLTQKLAVAFASAAAITAIIAVLVSAAAWNNQFHSYVRASLQSIADNIAASATYAYHRYGGWNFGSFSEIPRAGAQSKIAIQILDNDGQIIYDEASLRNHAAQAGALASQADVPEVDLRLSPVPKGEVLTSPILYNGEQVGMARVWSYSQGEFLNDRDIQLRNNSFFALAAAGILGILLSSIFGLLYARRITKPINCITQTAMEIRSGNSSARTRISGDDEISLLAETFDKMADSIEVDRMLERRLTNDVAHELRTPLMAVQATVEAMEDGILPTDAAQLHSVLRETKRLSRLTNAILELSRLENGSLPMAFAPINIATPVFAAIDAHRALFEAAELSLITDIDNTLTVNADMDRIQQAVGNLLSNAARYTPADGVVSVAVQHAGTFAVIEVKDSGIGMSQEDLKYLFTRFWRADLARDRASGGIGVGLAISKEIIERHGGSITVSSELDEGTTFSIYLPLYGDAQKHA